MNNYMRAPVPGVDMELLAKTDGKVRGDVVEHKGKHYVKGLGAIGQDSPVDGVKLQGEIISEKFWEVGPYVLALEDAYEKLTSANRTITEYLKKEQQAREEYIREEAARFNSFGFFGHIKLAFKSLFRGKNG